MRERASKPIGCSALNAHAIVLHPLHVHSKIYYIGQRTHFYDSFPSVSDVSIDAAHHLHTRWWPNNMHDTTMNGGEDAAAGHEVACPASRLPRLPGEVLNLIFSMHAPTHTSIAIHATVAKGNAIVFHPRQPALASTCRKLRGEFPLEQYYAENKFLLTESMFLPGRMTEFFRGRPLARKHMQHVRVDLLGIPWVDPQSRKLLLSAQSRLRFTVKAAEDGSIVISRLKARVCCCWISAIAKRVSKSKDAEGRLAAFLIGYASKAESRYAESRQFCPDCGLAKTGSNLDDKNARIVILFIMGLFLVVFGFLAVFSV